MVAQIKRFYLLLLLWIGKEQPSETLPASRPEREPDLYSFKANILDYLDDQFRVLKRMKKHDRGAYDLYKKVGAFVMADMWSFENAWDFEEYRHMRGWWKTHRPSFAAFYTGYRYRADDDDEDKILPSLIYFQKYDKKKPPQKVQRMHGEGDIYTMSFYWDNRDKIATVGEYALYVSKDGDIKCLKVLMNEPVNVRAKRRSSTVPRGRTFRVPNRKWGIHPFFTNWAKDVGMEVEALLIGNFIMAVNAFSRQHEEMTKIRVTKDGLVAVFSISILRTPYFFKDREVYKTPSGQRKPIFHIVRAHRRDLQTGGETYVRTHFRGHRKFVWNGYSINITVPGWHHQDLSTLDVKSHSVADDEDQTGYIDMKEIGDWYTGIENEEGRRVGAIDA